MKKILLGILVLLLVALVPSVSAAPAWGSVPTVTQWLHDTTTTVDVFSYLTGVVGAETLGIDDASGHFSGSGTCTASECIVTITPLGGWAGTESAVTFWVNDGTGKVSSGAVSLTVTNSAPVATAYTPAPLVTNEDTPIEITLVANDPDGDSIVYSIGTLPSHGSLSIIDQANHKLSYTPTVNYDGSDSFTFKVNDGVVDSTVKIVSITVNAVNDAPLLSTINDKKLQEDISVNELVFDLASDVDNTLLTYTLEFVGITNVEDYPFTLPNLVYDPLTSKVKTGSSWSWTPEKEDIGEFNLKLSVSDGLLTDSEEFKIYVYPKTMCEEGEKGNILSFTVEKPSDGDDFGPGDTINIEVNVENDAGDDKDYVVKAILYDIETGKKIEEVESDDENIDEDEDYTFRLEMQIPLDSDEDYKGDYVLYVKAYEDGNEDEQCRSDFIELNIGRESHEVIIQSIAISPSTVQAGDEFDVTVSVANIGKKDEEGVMVKLRSDELGIDLTSDAKDLGAYDESGNAYLFKFSGVKIPAGTDAKTYDLEAFVLFEGGSTSTSYLDSPIYKVSGDDLIVEAGGDVVDTTDDVTVTGDATDDVDDSEGFPWGTVLWIIGDIVLIVVAIFFIKLIFSARKRRPKVKEVKL